MNPRSSFAFDFSRPRFSVFGTRPTAISTRSAEMVCVFPALSVNATVAPCASFFTDSTLASVKIHAFFLQGFFEFRRNFLVFDRSHAWQHFQHRDFRPERI